MSSSNVNHGLMLAMSRNSSGPSPFNKITRGHSCLSCQQRKVRCDGQRPCSTCVRSGDQCAPAKSLKTIKRQDARSGLVNDRLRSRLKRCEELLQASGIKIEDDVAPDERVQRDSLRDVDTPASNVDDGQMIVEHGHSRYLEKCALLDHFCPQGYFQRLIYSVAIYGKDSVTR